MGKILKWQRYEQRLVGDAGSTKRPSKLVFHMMGKGIQWEKKKRSDWWSQCNQEGR